MNVFLTNSYDTIVGTDTELFIQMIPIFISIVVNIAILVLIIYLIRKYIKS